uniref:Uncharacterized protein n=1 Tax=Theileria annulata TaxID=5874 RepID=A0A3B0MXA0_THEAN
MTKNRSKSKFKKQKDDKSKKIKVSKNLVKNVNHDNDSKDSVKKIHKIKVKPDKVKKKDFENVNIKKFQTLEEYKLYISQICTRAITYPETELNNVNLLFNVIEKKGGGPDNLLEYVKNLSILSLVSVVCHLLPRVSHELSEVNLEVVKRTETAHSANVIAQEREITNKTIEIRDKLIALIKNNLNYDPDFFVPLISKLVEADNRVSDELLTLCLKYSKVSESCLESINSLFTHGSIVDIHRYLKFMLKSSHINHKVIRIINEIQINKKHHEFLLSEGSLKNEKTSKSKSNKEDKYKNEILSGIITFYTKYLEYLKY